MKKTFFVCTDLCRDNHVGEEYDDILFVESNPSSVTIQEWAVKIRDRLRRLWHDMPKDESENIIDVFQDVADAIHAVLANLQIIMHQEEKIYFRLAYLEPGERQPIDVYLERYGSKE